MGSEFVLHVPDEYDYRFSSFDKFFFNINLLFHLVFYIFIMNVSILILIVFITFLNIGEKFYSK